MISSGVKSFSVRKFLPRRFMMTLLLYILIAGGQPRFTRFPGCPSIFQPNRPDLPAVMPPLSFFSCQHWQNQCFSE
jgi:hypothetical protein